MIGRPVIYPNLDAVFEEVKNLLLSTKNKEVERRILSISGWEYLDKFYPLLLVANLNLNDYDSAWRHFQKNIATIPNTEKTVFLIRYYAGTKCLSKLTEQIFSNRFWLSQPLLVSAVTECLSAMGAKDTLIRLMEFYHFDKLNLSGSFLLLAEEYSKAKIQFTKQLSKTNQLLKVTEKNIKRHKKKIKDEEHVLAQLNEEKERWMHELSLCEYFLENYKLVNEMYRTLKPSSIADYVPITAKYFIGEHAAALAYSLSLRNQRVSSQGILNVTICGLMAYIEDEKSIATIDEILTDCQNATDDFLLAKVIYYLNSDLDSAETQLTDLIKQYPYADKAYLLLALVWMAKGLQQKANEILQQAKDVFPEFIVLHQQMKLIIDSPFTISFHPYYNEIKAREAALNLTLTTKTQDAFACVMKAVSGQIRLTGDALFQEVSTSLKLPPINVDKYEFISVIDDNCSFPDTVSGFEKIDKNKFIHHGSFDHPIAVTFFHESEYRKDILQKSSYISINFLASSATGQLFDPYTGVLDLKQRLIRTLKNPAKIYAEDAQTLEGYIQKYHAQGFFLEETLKAEYARVMPAIEPAKLSKPATLHRPDDSKQKAQEKKEQARQEAERIKQACLAEKVKNQKLAEARAQAKAAKKAENIRIQLAAQQAKADAAGKTPLEAVASIEKERAAATKLIESKPSFYPSLSIFQPEPPLDVKVHSSEIKRNIIAKK